jgi:hypothetical protein
LIVHHQRFLTAKQHFPNLSSLCKPIDIYLDISIVIMLAGSALSSVLAVVLVFALPAKAAPQQMMRRSTPELSLTAQLQIADT